MSIFENDGHKDGCAMKNAVYAFLERDEVEYAVCAEMECDKGAPDQEQVLPMTEMAPNVSPA